MKIVGFNFYSFKCAIQFSTMILSRKNKIAAEQISELESSKYCRYTELLTTYYKCLLYRAVIAWLPETKGLLNNVN